MEKDFDNWAELKKSLQKHEKLPTFSEREIWWSSVGMNVGHEEDGKNEFFSRPVLIIRKFNENLFIAAPLTKQIKVNYYYHKIHFKEIEQCVLLSQIKSMSSKRLASKIGDLSSKQFKEIREKLVQIINP